MSRKEVVAPGWNAEMAAEQGRIRALQLVGSRQVARAMEHWFWGRREDAIEGNSQKMMRFLLYDGRSATDLLISTSSQALANPIANQSVKLVLLSFRRRGSQCCNDGRQS